MAKQQHIVVVGAGLVGSLWALLLSKRGHRVQVIERRPDMRRADISAGLSINLALSGRGLKALDIAGAGDAVREHAIAMHGRLIHDLDGSTNLQPYGEQGQFINSVSRGGLNCVLMDKAEEAGAEIRFDRRCTEVTFGDDGGKPSATFVDDHGDSETLTPDVIFGCDGAFSAVRQAMLPTTRFNYRIDWLEHGYKELVIPPSDEGDFRIDPNALHIWPRGSYMLIALANPDKTFTCTLFLPFEGEKRSFDALRTPADVNAFFDEVFADAKQHMPTLTDDFFENPTGSLGTVRCRPWQRHGKVCLLGDAAHAIVPFYGQGMNAGFEDCSVLHALLDEHRAGGEDRFGPAIEQFAQVRKPDADAIADLALYNFIEMRDRVADDRFVLQKKIERKLHALYGERYLPLYSMVTFSHLPYAEAKAFGDAQEALMQEILDLDGIGERWDSEAFEPELRRRVDALLASR